jgi:hypothetical protein
MRINSKEENEDGEVSVMQSQIDKLQKDNKNLLNTIR